MIALLLVLQAAELEALSRAYGRLESFRVEYLVVPPATSTAGPARVVAAVDRPRRRAYATVSPVDPEDARRMHVMFDGDLVRFWSATGPAVRYDLRAETAAFRGDRTEPETGLRSLLPPAFSAPVPELPLVPSFMVDLEPDGERGTFRFALVWQSPAAFPPWLSRLRRAVAVEGGPDAVFRFPDQKKTCRIDRTTGLIRSVRLEIGDDQAGELTLKEVTNPADFVPPALPPKITDQPVPVDFLLPYLWVDVERLNGLLAAVRGTWTKLPDAARFPPLLRRWCVAYAGAVRVQRIRGWMAAYLRDLLEKDPGAVPAERLPELAALFHDRMSGAAEQEKAFLLPLLKSLADDLRPEGAAAKDFDAAFKEASAPDAVVAELPAWTVPRVQDLLREELERARPK